MVVAAGQATRASAPLEEQIGVLGQRISALNEQQRAFRERLAVARGIPPSSAQSSPADLAKRLTGLAYETTDAQRRNSALDRFCSEWKSWVRGNFRQGSDALASHRQSYLEAAEAMLPLWGEAANRETSAVVAVARLQLESLKHQKEEAARHVEESQRLGGELRQLQAQLQAQQNELPALYRTLAQDTIIPAAEATPGLVPTLAHRPVFEGLGQPMSERREPGTAPPPTVAAVAGAAPGASVPRTAQLAATPQPAGTWQQQQQQQQQQQAAYWAAQGVSELYAPPPRSLADHAAAASPHQHGLFAGSSDLPTTTYHPSWPVTQDPTCLPAAAAAGHLRTSGTQLVTQDPTCLPSPAASLPSAASHLRATGPPLVTQDATCLPSPAASHFHPPGPLFATQDATCLPSPAASHLHSLGPQLAMQDPTCLPSAAASQFHSQGPQLAMQEPTPLQPQRGSSLMEECAQAVASPAVASPRSAAAPAAMSASSTAQEPAATQAQGSIAASLAGALVASAVRGNSLMEGSSQAEVSASDPAELGEDPSRRLQRLLGSIHGRSCDASCVWRLQQEDSGLTAVLAWADTGRGSAPSPEQRLAASLQLLRSRAREEALERADGARGLLGEPLLAYLGSLDDGAALEELCEVVARSVLPAAPTQLLGFLRQQVACGSDAGALTPLVGIGNAGATRSVASDHVGVGPPDARLAGGAGPGPEHSQGCSVGSEDKGSGSQGVAEHRGPSKSETVPADDHGVPAVCPPAASAGDRAQAASRTASDDATLPGTPPAASAADEPKDKSLPAGLTAPQAVAVGEEGDNSKDAPKLPGHREPASVVEQPKAGSLPAGLKAKQATAAAAHSDDVDDDGMGQPASVIEQPKAKSLPAGLRVGQAAFDDDDDSDDDIKLPERRQPAAAAEQPKAKSQPAGLKARRGVDDDDDSDAGIKLPGKRQPPAAAAAATRAAEQPKTQPIGAQARRALVDEDDDSEEDMPGARQPAAPLTVPPAPAVVEQAKAQSLPVGSRARRALVGEDDSDDEDVKMPSGQQLKAASLPAGLKAASGKPPEQHKAKSLPAGLRARQGVDDSDDDDDGIKLPATRRPAQQPKAKTFPAASRARQAADDDDDEDTDEVRLPGTRKPAQQPKAKSLARRPVIDDDDDDDDGEALRRLGSKSRTGHDDSDSDTKLPGAGLGLGSAKAKAKASAYKQRQQQSSVPMMSAYKLRQQQQEKSSSASRSSPTGAGSKPKPSLGGGSLLSKKIRGDPAWATATAAGAASDDEIADLAGF